MMNKTQAGLAFRRLPPTVRAFMPDQATSPKSSSVHASEAFFSPLRGHIKALDDFLFQQINEFEPAVQQLVRYTFEHRGKRLRPGLVFYAGWTGREPSLDTIRAAAIVELVHLATLVHDDILDEASLRHNSLTVTAKYGQHSAVLLGDALFAQALKLASDYPTTEVCRLVATATRQVCSGEICQTFDRGNTMLPMEQYFRIIQMKTAELFEVSCQLGAHFAFGEKAYTEACSLFGRHLGIAYQIFDDIADFAGDEADIGKTLGTDLASGKFTLPTLLYLRTLKEADAKALADSLRKNEIPLSKLAASLKAARIPAECVEVFENELGKAETALAPHKDKPSVQLLLQIAEYIKSQLLQLRFA
ncbi:MAG: polyprenyl synthetase family protein [Puniceicoccales bacterium]|jgi:octaprenyl-diphosphate synthase|nr:polyprenyl synthetase family protein [Puniceicoccales bacterium]